MKNTLGYCLVCHSDEISIEEIAAEIQVTKISIYEFKLCISCRTKIEKCLEIIRTKLVKDENEILSLSYNDKRALRIGLKARMKVRDLKSAERRKYYFK